MTMLFRQVKDSLVSLLGGAAAGQYRVIGYEPAPDAASEFAGTNRTVRCFFQDGSFPKNAGSMGTPAKHEVSMILEMVQTAITSVDFSVLDDPNSTPAERAAALSGKTEAAEVCDSGFDEFLDILWNVIMIPGNRTLGMPKNIVASRWVSNLKKDKILHDGNYVILTGYLKLDFSVDEKSVGVTPVAFDKNVTTFTPIDGDETQATVQET